MKCILLVCLVTMAERCSAFVGGESAIRQFNLFQLSLLMDMVTFAFFPIRCGVSVNEPMSRASVASVRLEIERSRVGNSLVPSGFSLRHGN